MEIGLFSHFEIIATEIGNHTPWDPPESLQNKASCKVNIGKVFAINFSHKIKHVSFLWYFVKKLCISFSEDYLKLDYPIITCEYRQKSKHSVNFC